MIEGYKNIFSHLTAKERNGPSFPTKYLFNNNYLKGEILDFGCGFGEDIKFLSKNGLNADGYDIYYQPELKEKQYDVIICNYVLNVLLPEQQSEVLMRVSEILKPGGVAYFTVRRDLKYIGYRQHKIHQEYTYQCNVILPYKSVYKNENCEIYEYKHYIKSNNNNNCPFCNLSRNVKLITESATAYAIYDGFPVSMGHSLIIPKKHVSNYFELSFKEQFACWIVVNRVKTILQQKHNPDGFNIGININRDAGQTVEHVHIHLIPRFKGDVENPKGGIRHVIPGKGFY